MMGKGQGSQNKKPSDMKSPLGKALTEASQAGKKGSKEFCKVLQAAQDAAALAGNFDLAQQINGLAKQMGCKPSGFKKCIKKKKKKKTNGA